MSPRASARADAWTRAAFALVLIWTLAGGGVMLARSLRPTAAEAIAFFRRQNVEPMTADERAAAMRQAAEKLSQLDVAQMGQLQRSRALFRFYQPLTPREKEEFAAMIVPDGLRRILDASRDEPPERRAKFVRQALFQASLELSLPEPAIDPEALLRIERDAVTAYAGSLGPEKRVEMEPLLRGLREYFQPATAPGR